MQISSKKNEGAQSQEEERSRNHRPYKNENNSPNRFTEQKNDGNDIVYEEQSQLKLQRKQLDSRKRYFYNQNSNSQHCEKAGVANPAPQLGKGGDAVDGRLVNQTDRSRVSRKSANRYFGFHE